MLRDLLRSAQWRRWTVASLLARMPVSMALLGMMLAVEEATGSLSTGSQVVGVMTISAGVLGPASGRWLDRHEIRGALQVRCTALGVALIVMAVLVAANTPTWTFFALSLMCGVTLAGVWGGFRALLVVVRSVEERRHAHFVESLMIEVSYGTGPLLIGLTVALFNAVAGLVLMAGFSFAATVALLRIDRHEPLPVVRIAAPWRHGAFATIYAFGFFLGVSFGAVESNVAARMDEFGLDSSAAGPFIGLLATSSVAGGLWVSLRPMRSADPMKTAAWMFAVFGLSLVPTVLASSVWAFAIALLFASFMLVPLNGLGAAEIESRATPGQRAEAFAYLMAATQMGSGLGVTLNGTLTEWTAAQNVPLMAAGLLLSLGLGMTLLRLAVTPRDSEPLSFPPDDGVAVMVTSGSSELPVNPPRTSTGSGAS